MKKRTAFVTMAVICFLGTLVSSAEEPLWTATFDEIPSSGYFRTERTQSDPVSGLLDAVAAVLSEPVTQADNITYEVVFQSLGGEWSTFTRFGLFAVPGDFLENCLNIYGDSGAAATFYGYVEGGGGSSIQFVPGTSTAFNEPRFLRYTYTAADRNEHVLMVKGTDDSATGEDVLVDWSPANIRIPEAAEFTLTHFAFSDSSTNVFNFEWHLGVDRVTVWKNDQVVLNEEFDSGLGAFTVFSANGAKQAAWPACRLDGFHHMSGGTYDQQATVLPEDGGALSFIGANPPFINELAYALCGRAMGDLGHDGGPEAGWGMSFNAAVEEAQNNSAAAFGFVFMGAGSVPPEVVPTKSSMFLQVTTRNVGANVELTPTIYANSADGAQVTASGAPVTVTKGQMYLFKVGLHTMDGQLEAEILADPAGPALTSAAVAVPAEWTFGTDPTGYGGALCVAFGDGLVTTNTDFENRAKGTWVIDNISLFGDFPSEPASVTEWSLY